MVIFLLIVLALAAAYFWVAVVGPLRRLTSYSPQDKEDSLPLGPMPFLVPQAVRRLAQRVKDEVLLESEMRAHLLAQRRISSGIFDSLDSGVVLVESGLAITFGNGAFRKYFSPRGDFLGRSLLELCLHHEIAEMAEEQIRGTGGDARVLDLEVYLEGRLQHRHFRVRATPAELEGSPGRKAILFVFEDVTRLRELETIRRDFVANASHELRTPLSILKGYIENLQDGALEDPEMARRFLGIMEKNCDRLTSIVKDLLTVSRLESHTFSLELEPIDLEECVHGVVEQLKPLICANQVALVLDIEPRPFLLRADRFSFDQIFFNLIENAIKHNAGRELRLTVHARQVGETALIDFQDNGIGIPKEDQPFVFNRFYRVTRGRTGIAEGTGLGLSIVKNALEAHGGEVAIDSRPGAGTKIQMRLPNARVAQEALTAVSG